MKATVEAIRKWRDICALFFAGSVFFTALFASLRMPGVAIFCGTAVSAAFACLFRQNRLLHGAGLICDNCILSVPLAVISTANGSAERVEEEIVVSTFGLLLGNKVYRWGCDGTGGARLSMIRLDRARIWLTFGTEDETLCIELLHGLTDRQKAMEITQKLWRETGVRADTSDW